MNCSHTDSHVKDARDFRVNGLAGCRRFRECVHCKQKFYTYEFQYDALFHFMQAILEPAKESLSEKRVNRYLRNTITRVSKQCGKTSVTRR